MINRTVLAAVVMASLGSAAQAQDRRVEISGTAGFTNSDGVSGGASDVFGNPLARIDPDDAFSWGLRIGFMMNENTEIGALFSTQATSLLISSDSPNLPGEFTLGDASVNNYHGYFAYNFGESETVKPYVLLGLGATQFGTVTVNTGGLPTPHRNAPPEIDGNTKFSTTWAAGLKLFPSPSFGVRLEARWTPTYIKSDAEGWWCDPYWGCYTVGDAQYANQFEFGGGIVLRF